MVNDAKVGNDIAENDDIKLENNHVVRKCLKPDLFIWNIWGVCFVKKKVHNAAIKESSFLQVFQFSVIQSCPLCKFRIYILSKIFWMVLLNFGI